MKAKRETAINSPRLRQYPGIQYCGRPRAGEEAAGAWVPQEEQTGVEVRPTKIQVELIRQRQEHR